jgi:arylsulfatase A
MSKFVFRKKMNLFFGILIFVLPIFLGCEQQYSKDQFNIVFILADDLGWNQVGYHGTTFYETPNIDLLASQGMQFSNAYTSAPVCSPTRAGLMTGRHPARLHLTDYIPGSPYPFAKLVTQKQAPCLPLEEVTIPEKLKEMGYVTGHFGKWHLSIDKNYEPGRPFDPASQGFDVVYTSVKPPPETDPEKDAHHAIEITEGSLKFIEDYHQQPFFLYVSHHIVHRPLMEKADLIAKYQAKEDSDKPYNNPVMGAMVERLDWSVGEILKKLEEFKLSERTVVVFYSDNGGLEQLQDQDPLRGGKATIFDGGLRVPLAIKWPGVIKAGSRSNDLVTSEDFFPTLMEIAGIAYAKETLDGVSLIPVLNGTGHLDKNTLFFHYPHYHHQGYRPAGAIREGDYKLIEWYEESVLGLDNQVNLYNLKEDIGEAKDLSSQMPEKVADLRKKLHHWRQAVGAQEMTANPNYDQKKADNRFAAE